MSYALRLSRKAEQDIFALFAYLSEHRSTRAGDLIRVCMGAIEDVGRAPYRWPYFRLTGEPFRARLIRIGQSTVWLIYRVNEAERSVAILRLWDSRQNPSVFRG